MMKEQKGITLIALVITIIVLLILAGVSIAMLTGENGLLTQSQRAVAEQAVAEAKELVSTEVAAAYAQFMEDKYTNSSVTKDTTFTSWLGTNTSAIKANADKYTVSGSSIEIKPTGKSKDGTKDVKTTGTVKDTGTIEWKTAEDK